MKVFVINLARDVNKRLWIEKECARQDLDFEIYSAVDGGGLSEAFLNENVFDYGKNFMTNGEIGCALSHINLYKKIIDDDLKYALIIEDDAVLDDGLKELLLSFEKENKNEGIFLLTGGFEYIENKKIDIGSFEFFPVNTASMTTGYIITIGAAKKMLDFLLPVRFEADMFKIFRICAGVNIYGKVPHFISTNDKDKVSSSIEMERSLVSEKRMDYRHVLFKKEERKKRISRFFWRVFLRKLEKVKKYEAY
ncbi:glycosyltransferase family 25 protein [Citrobacter sp. JGM124]|uniref:glycosyltransferase family 25 protein n=1 Tax=Citrobacter sp. JGM124 TaxID=2799789 RepID=UPI001BA9E846|nr:glycosyltransferase family 25 protein [Citrobacter sp. JGM124]MBS0848442.1 glycosyltransferase family 25 protein [Citrobacter sp. JGM124]